MPIVWTKKPWKRDYHGETTTVAAGKPVSVELRSELERGLAEGYLTRSKREAEEAAEEFGPDVEGGGSPKPRKPFTTREDPRTAEAVKGLGQRMGWPENAARIRYHEKAAEMDGAAPQQICRAVRTDYGALTLREQVEDLSAEIGEDPDEIEAAVQHHAQRLGRVPGQIVPWFSFAYDLDKGRDLADFSAVFDRLHELTRLGVMELDAAMDLVREEQQEGPIRAAAEAEGEITEASVVRVDDPEHILHGKEGVVQGVQSNGKLRVAFERDPDRKRYRVLGHTQVDLVPLATEHAVGEEA